MLTDMNVKMFRSWLQQVMLHLKSYKQTQNFEVFGKTSIWTTDKVVDRKEIELLLS